MLAFGCMYQEYTVLSVMLMQCHETLKNSVLVRSLTLQIYYVYSNVFYMYFELTFFKSPQNC